uniref:Uncharacterized protein n=1 Tax=Aegilops tauschii subsp. strangulata TaxID=200361 RepID=A0A453IT06_AEGTS
EGLVQQYVDHALCRFRYYKYKLQLSQPKEEPHGDNLLEEEEDDKEEREYLATLTEKQLLFLEEDDATSEEDDNLMDKTEHDCNMEFLEEKGFFISFEEDGTLDWFFYPAYCECASLSDYQRLVLKNYVSYLQFIIVVNCTGAIVCQSHTLCSLQNCHSCLERSREM